MGTSRFKSLEQLTTTCIGILKGHFAVELQRPPCCFGTCLFWHEVSPGKSVLKSASGVEDRPDNAHDQGGGQKDVGTLPRQDEPAEGEDFWVTVGYTALSGSGFIAIFGVSRVLEAMSRQEDPSA